MILTKEQRLENNLKEQYDIFNYYSNCLDNYRKEFESKLDYFKESFIDSFEELNYLFTLIVIFAKTTQREYKKLLDSRREYMAFIFERDVYEQDKD